MGFVQTNQLRNGRRNEASRVVRNAAPWTSCNQASRHGTPEYKPLSGAENAGTPWNFVQTKPAPERGAGIKPGVERSGTPGTSHFNQISPGTGRRNKARGEAKRRELHGVRSK